MPSAQPRNRSTALRLCAGAAAGALLAATAPSLTAFAAPPTTPFISEIHYDNDGTDVGEFIEVQLPAGTSSEGLNVILYNGSNGASYATLPLPTVTAPSDASGVVAVDGPASGIQNGSPDGMALVAADGSVLEFLSYEGAMTATNGPAAGRTSIDIGVEETSSTPIGQSLSRYYDAATDALVWTGPAAATRGVLNSAPSTEPDPDVDPASCEIAPENTIGEVQGPGDVTPLDGQQVTVQGVVVADLPGLDGFNIQDPAGIPGDDISDGVFVFTGGAAEVGIGDLVAVTGTAGEYFEQTQITATGADSVAVCDEDVALPAPAVLEFPSDDAEREALEGMLVVPSEALTVSEVYDLTFYGELALAAGGVLVQPTELARPGAAAEAIAEENRLRSIVLDDASTERLSATNRPYLSAETPVRVGDELTFTEPLVLGYGFDAWRLQPADGTADGVFLPQNTRPAQPETVGGDIQIGAFNVLNYFLTFGGVGRGAPNADEFEEQANKIVPAIEALGAEVVTLMEIEDTDSTGYSEGDADGALADLVSRLNAAAGSDKWDYIPLPEELYDVDRDVIRNAIIYQPAAVTPVGDPVGLVDEDVWFNAREPQAQSFERDGDVFTVVANHFKSKGASGASGDNVDAGDGQGAYNGDRTRQAASLLAFVDDLVEQTGDSDVMLLGDFNAYSQEDPAVAITDAGFVDLGSEFDAGNYSYVFDALSGSLDHAFATASMADKVTDATHWNINSVESFAYQYEGDPELYAPNAYRSSDHDPLVVGFAPEGTEDPGTEQPGTEDPGTEQPGTEDPNDEQPGTGAGNGSGTGTGTAGSSSDAKGLASTGVDAGLTAAIAAGASLLLLAGLAFAVLGRRLRGRSES